MSERKSVKEMLNGADGEAFEKFLRKKIAEHSKNLHPLEKPDPDFLIMMLKEGLIDETAFNWVPEQTRPDWFKGSKFDFNKDNKDV